MSIRLQQSICFSSITIGELENTICELLVTACFRQSSSLVAHLQCHRLSLEEALPISMLSTEWMIRKIMKKLHELLVRWREDTGDISFGDGTHSQMHYISYYHVPIPTPLPSGNALHSTRIQSTVAQIVKPPNVINLNTPATMYFP